MTRAIPLLATTLAAFLAASAAFADYEQDIVRQLQGMGFSRVEVSRTLLGRVRITAAGADGTREIILNPNTGEILRDLWLRQDGRSSDRALLDGGGGSDDRSSGSGSSGGWSSGSDDDDDDDNDNSGSNSGSSGRSGNSGSGSSGKSGGGSDDSSDKGGDDDDDD
jgi:hypothetical protein